MNDYTYNPTEMITNWNKACGIVRANVTEERKFDWFYRETERYPAHPAVLAALKVARPHNWQQLLLEWPHVSVHDVARVAYTRDERAGESDKQTVTSIGKYLRRHWTDYNTMPDHTIRDLVARYGTNTEYKIVRTTAEMLHHLSQGPGSCMVWSRSGLRCSDGQTRHPYEVYDPKYGWAMAVGILNGETVSRALVIDTPDSKYYVRAYLRPTNDGYSQTASGMENWLKEQGFSKHYSWEDGQKMAYFPTGDHFLAPYLDGDTKNASIAVDYFLVIDRDGDYRLSCTDGSAVYEGDDEEHFDCEDCGDRTHDDDGYWIGRGEDTHVCRHCVDNNYTYVYGRRGNEYYVHNDYAVQCDSDCTWYDQDYLSDNNVVMLENGGCVSIDDAVCVDGDWYHTDDEAICYAEDTGEYAMRNDCWECAESGNMYTDDCEDYVELNDERYHNDHIPAWVQDELDAADETETTTEGE